MTPGTARWHAIAESNFDHGARADEFPGAARDWLLARLESPRHWPRPGDGGDDAVSQLASAARLADAAGRDGDFMQVAALYAGHAGFDVQHLVAELVVAESVPFPPVARHADTGLRKRVQWEATWALQRREDAIDAEVLANDAPGWRDELTAEARTRFGLPAAGALTPEVQAWVEETLAAEVKRHQDERKAEEVGAIPVPPKYQGKDFLKAHHWRLRDGLDMKDTEGWEPARLQPLLAGLLELVPWLKQWHNEVDPAYGERMGDYYAGVVGEEARTLGFTLDDLRAWRPAPVASKRGRRKAAVATSVD